MSSSTIKEEARQLVERLPEDATWEDLQYEISVRQAIKAGLKDSREERTVPLGEARRSVLESEEKVSLPPGLRARYARASAVFAGNRSVIRDAARHLGCAGAGGP